MNFNYSCSFVVDLGAPHTQSIECVVMNYNHPDTTQKLLSSVLIHNHDSFAQITYEYTHFGLGIIQMYGISAHRRFMRSLARVK